MSKDTDRPVRVVTRREALSGAGLALGSLVASGTLTETVMAQSGGPSDEISGIVEDDSGPVDGATVVAVPHDTSLAALETTTDASGNYIFEQADLHGDSNLYHVIARDGTESDPRRGEQNYPFVAAEGVHGTEANQKLIHRWYLSEQSDPFIDQIGSADATDNGTTRVTGDWVDGAARDGDGTDDYIETTTWGNFGSNMGDGFAIAFSIQGTEGLSSGSVATLGTFNDDFATALQVPNPDDNSSDAFYLRSDGGSVGSLSWGNASAYENGNPHRIVYNVPDATDVSGWEIWADQSSESVSFSDGEGVSTFSDFDYPVTLFARNVRGTIESYTDCILDDVCVYGEALTQTEIESYTNPWS